MIHLKNLSKKYQGTTVLEIPQLEIQKGSCFGLIGNNGAGKTTLFSLLLDLIQPSSGSVTNKGSHVAQSEAWKNHTTAYIDESFLIGYLTAEEYFDFVASLRELSKQELAESLEAFQSFFNDEVLQQKKYLRDLSKGNQKKVGIIASLLGEPELVILDEPFANLDPSSQIQLKRIIQEQAQKQGKTFLISSHDLSHVTEICDRIVLLEKGCPIQDIQTSPSTLKELERYFGSSLY